MTSDVDNEAKDSTTWKRAALGVFATLFLGAVGSGIWEVLFRPGLSLFGDFLSSASASFESSVYSMAALDPQPLPGLMLLLVLSILPLMVSILFFMETFVRPPLDRIIKSHIERSTRGVEDRLEIKRIVHRKRWAAGGMGIIVMGVFGAVTLVGFTQQNEATKIWRIYQSNLEIIAAVAPEQDVRTFRAKFRMMKRREDFVALKREMDALAGRGSVSLNWYGV
jgi:hypothetical protein